jgi:glycosyltransferase involved in cell wall biosynthesis
MSIARDRTACMMRIRNEARWIRRSLERTFEVCKTVVLWDDGSTDDTWLEAVRAVCPPFTMSSHHPDTKDWALRHGGALGRSIIEYEDRVLYFLPSPFAFDVVRPTQRADEIRDKNALWAFLKARVLFDYVLCLDGDEMLSREALRKWPEMLVMMDAGVDYIKLPFVYLWDREDQQRCDAIYGPEDVTQKTLTFPRLFTIQRLTNDQLFDTRFDWRGTKGGLHCGSIPQEGFRPNGGLPRIETVGAPVIHWGYFDEELRQRKYVFYNTVDSGNEFEGGYLHIIGKKNHHAPGDVQFAPYEDA